ncbi:MAG: tRNA preQ1(34) S-adenosylmethionine ribosyltransferase-isomerase QueA, partial [Planctomycetota bacterium]
MQVSLFDYNLPEELIAKEPLAERDSSRLLILNRKSGAIQHRLFKEIPEFLKPNDLLVMNDTKVFPARTHGYRNTGAKAEVLFLNKFDDNTWEVLIGTRGHPQTREVFVLSGGKLRITILDKTESGTYLVRPEPTHVFDILDEYGEVPLPPYILKKSQDGRNRKLDLERYQTVYATNRGSAAAPTAGLHFTDSLLSKIKNAGVNMAAVTLHISYETFRPVKEELVDEHKMYHEFYNVPPETFEAIKRTKSADGRVIAVGTTSCRVLETIGIKEELNGSTNIFIYPPFDFKNTDSLITNFHLPKSTLLMLVSAFAGRETVIRAYEEAVQQR